MSFFSQCIHCDGNLLPSDLFLACENVTILYILRYIGEHACVVHILTSVVGKLETYTSSNFSYQIWSI